MQIFDSERRLNINSYSCSYCYSLQFYLSSIICNLQFLIGLIFKVFAMSLEVLSDETVVILTFEDCVFSF